MKRLLYSFVLLIALPSILFAKGDDMKPGLYANIATNKGEIVVSLFTEEMPISVANFVALAEGKKKGDLLKSLQKKKFYEGSVFQDKVSRYLIGSTNPNMEDLKGIGYTVPFEQNDSLLTLDNTLLLSSSSEENNGSQLDFSFRFLPFFSSPFIPIGQIVSGVEAAKSLEKGDKINTVSILRVGKEAKKYNAEKVFKEKMIEIEQEEEMYRVQEKERLVQGLNQLLESDDEAYQEFAKRKLFALEKAEVLPSGVRMVKTRETENNFAIKGDAIRVNYTGYLADGTIFDTSYTNPRPMLFKLGKGEVIKGFDEVFSLLRIGEKATVFIPSSSAYGRDGAGSKIAPYTTLIFDVTMVDLEK